MIEVRLCGARLHRLYPGVYAVGHLPITADARWLAAVLACDGDALLSHRSGADLWDVRRSGAIAVDVTAPTRRGYRCDGIALHRATTLHPDDRTTRRSIPVTTLERTIVDLGSVVSRDAHEYALHRAEQRRLLDLAGLRAVLARMPANHRGAARTRAIIGAGDHAQVAATRGPAERRFLRLCAVEGIPTPRVNTWIPLPIASGGVEVDFCWPEERLIVEVDEQRNHDTHRARRNDPARDRALVAAGWRPIRIPEDELVQRPAAVAADVRDALAADPTAPGRNLHR